MPDTLMRIFISYTQPDSAFVERLKGDLGQQGFGSTAERQELPVGQRWRRALQAALDSCQALLVVLSPEAVADEEVRSQYSYALEEGKVVIPLIHQACKVPLALRSVRRINFQDSYEQGLAVLVKALQQLAIPTTSQRETETTAERPWNVPFARNPFFTGRAQLLEQLHTQLQRSSSVALNQSYALSGLGGIGKTQTAIEYAHRYREEYSAVFWARADSRETLVADFVALARLLGLPSRDAAEQMQIVAATKRWLEQHEGWLLILDNADELSLVRDFLPSEGKGHVLLTTRVQATGKIAESLPVEKLERSEGMQLVLRRAKVLAPEEPLDNVSRAARTAAQKLVEELDGLPLALDQAGAYIEEIGCSLSEYLELYQRRRLALLKRGSLVSADYPHTVASTWSLSFGKVEQASPAAAELLRLCAFLHPDAIPEEIITKGAGDLGPMLSQVSDDPFLLNEAIQVLRRYSLLKRDAEAKLLYLHRLVQVVLKDAMDQQMQRQWAERTVRALNAVFPEVSFETWSRCERCLPHVQACVDLIEQNTFTFPEAARLLDQAGYYLSERGLYRQAEPLLEQALVIRKQAPGLEHPGTASTLDHLAELYYLLGKYEQAESLFQHALAIREKMLGSEQAEIATTLDHLGWLYQAQGKYEQAEPLHLRALAIREQKLGPEHHDTATTLDHLAGLYQIQGKYERAEPLYQRALTIYEKVLPPDHPHTAATLNNLAGIYQDQGRYGEAEPLYQRALGIYEKVLPPDHPRTADILNDLAVLYTMQGRHVEAEPLLQHALAIRERALPPDHPETAWAYSNLAACYWHQGRYAEAEPLFQRALTIWKQALGPEHPDTGYAFDCLAQLYQEQGRYAEAEPLYQRALDIREQALGLEHFNTAGTLNNLGQLYRIQGRYAEAEPLLQHALAIREKVLGPDHPHTANTLNNLAGLYQSHEKYEQALRLYQRALSIREQALGAEHPRTAATLDSLGTLYSAQGKYEQAEPLYQGALAIREQKLGPTHPDVAQSLHHLATLYQAQGKYEQAEPLYRRALAVREQALGPEHPDTINLRGDYNELLRVMQGQESVTRQREG